MRAAGMKTLSLGSSATVTTAISPKSVCQLPDQRKAPTAKTEADEWARSETDLQKPSRSGRALLRYFNPSRRPPVRRHEKDPGIEQPDASSPGSPLIHRESLAIFGNDYPTEDGTGVRDYIRMMDLADSRVADHGKTATKPVHIYNLGAGVSGSVLDVVNAFNRPTANPLTTISRRAT